MKRTFNYYRYYDELFGRFRNYDDDIALVETLAGPIKERTIVEIGAGTGNHVAALIKKGANVQALDTNPIACQILRERFLPEMDVDVIQACGLNEPLQGDLLCCFFPIAQEALCVDSQAHRLESLFNKADSFRSGVIFEWIDIDKHLAKYAGQSTDLANPSESLCISLTSTEVDQGASLSYRGHLGGVPFDFSVTLQRLSESNLRELAGRLGLRASALPVSASGRKKLWHVCLTR